MKLSKVDLVRGTCVAGIRIARREALRASR